MAIHPPTVISWMLGLNDIRRSLEQDDHELTEQLRAIVNEMGRVSDQDAMPKVLIVVNQGRITPLIATSPITVVLVDQDGTPDDDQSDRITLEHTEDGELAGDAVFEACVLQRASPPDPTQERTPPDHADSGTPARAPEEALEVLAARCRHTGEGVVLTVYNLPADMATDEIEEVLPDDYEGPVIVLNGVTQASRLQLAQEAPHFRWQGEALVAIDAAL